MNELMNVLPSILEGERLDETGKEILTCEEMGQKARASRLRLQIYARLCAASDLEFIVRVENPYDYDNGSRSCIVDSPDITDIYSGTIPFRKSDLCPLKEWPNAMPTKVVDNVLAIKDKIDLASLFIEHNVEHDESDPALLYFLGEVRGLEYYVKLAEW